MQDDGGAAEALGGGVVLGELVGDHDLRAADHDLRMPDPAFVGVAITDLNGPKRCLVELNRPFCVMDPDHGSQKLPHESDYGVSH